MQTDLKQLADEAIELELNAQRLYTLFASLFAEDAAFWRQLALEEQHHADLLRTGIDFFLEAGFFPRDMFTATLSGLQQANGKLASLLKQYETAPPTRARAFAAGLQTERSAGEIHFQRLMEQEADSRVVELFQELNADDKDHAERILERMKEQGICEQDS